jgi:hypothetical protein
MTTIIIVGGRLIVVVDVKRVSPSTTLGA